MRVGIAGAGAVGCHYGSLLQQSGHEVRFLARGAHLQALRDEGLLHVSDGVETRLAVRAGDDAALLAGSEVILLASKITGLAALLTRIAPHVAAHTLLVTLQNGAVAPEMVQQAFPRHAVAAATPFIGVRIERPGMIVHSAAGGMRLGRWQPGPGDVLFAPLLDALQKAGVSVREEADARLMLWRKLLWNVGFNALTAITRRDARDIAAGEKTLELARSAMAEAVAVARRAGVNLSEGDIDRHVQATLGAGPVKTSMWQDIELGRPTEVDYINGYVASLGAELGIATPVNEMLTVLVHAIEAGRQTGPAASNEERR
jgi:2-dehydropantoate 2-reductase